MKWSREIFDNNMIVMAKSKRRLTEIGLNLSKQLDMDEEITLRNQIKGL